jgi:hypothetical protein
LSAVVFGTGLGFEHRPRAAPQQLAASVEASIEGHKPPTNGPIEPWELHSELALVCPEVRKRALALLAERNPEAFLTRTAEPISRVATTIYEAQQATSLPLAVVGYALWRLIETTRSAAIAMGAAVALALIAEIVH